MIESNQPPFCQTDVTSSSCRNVELFGIAGNVLQLHAVAEALACAVGAIECRCCYTLPLLRI
jgi:hypothetical protein